MYDLLYIHRYILTYVFMYIHICKCVQIYLLNMPTYIFIFTHTYFACMYIFMSRRINIFSSSFCVHIFETRKENVRVLLYSYICIYTHAHICIHVFICIYMYICIFQYSHVYLEEKHYSFTCVPI